VKNHDIEYSNFRHDLVYLYECRIFNGDHQEK